MKSKLILLVAVVGAMLISLPLFAHHSFMSEYGGAAVNLKGKLVKFDWVNPHSWAYVEVTGTDGKKVIWKGETPPINVLFRNGWTKPYVEGLVTKGEEVTMSGTPAKDGSNHIFATNMTILSTNTVMSLNGAPPADAETNK
jgi:hypothetical protein